jgi:uncharacterized protein YprB with RNaseH-like and TPR domain
VSQLGYMSYWRNASFKDTITATILETKGKRVFFVSTLSDRLRSLGVKVGVSEISSPPKEERYPIERVLPGSYLNTDQGQAYIVQQDYPVNYVHGKQTLLIDSPLLVIEKWAREPGLHNLSPESFAFFDTETSGLAGGTGTFAFLVGAGRFEKDHFHLEQFFMRDPSEEGALLLGLEKFLAPCKALVSFNGKAFDAPLLNTRYALAGWKSPLIDMQHVDLLHLARRLWRDRLPSRTLGNLEVQILGTSRNEEEVPGWMIPQLYFDYLRSGDAREMKNVFYHNAMDVVSLAALFKHVAGLLSDPLHQEEMDALDQASIARLFEDLEDEELAIQLYTDSLQQRVDSLHDEQYWNALERLSFLYKRREEYAQASVLWEEAAHNGRLYAFVELAKVYEHTLGDLPQALEWTQKAIDCIEKTSFSAFERSYWKPELEHRLERLNRKISAIGEQVLDSD